MPQTPYFFLPPLDEPWRIVSMTNEPACARIDWFPQDATATDWLSSELAHPDPSLVTKWNKLYDDNPGSTTPRFGASPATWA